MKRVDFISRGLGWYGKSPLRLSSHKCFRLRCQYRETNPVTANTIKDWQAAAQLQVVKVFFPLHVKTAYVLFFSKMLILVTSHHIQQPFSARCRMWISGFWSTVHSTGKFSFADCAIAILRSQMWQADRPCRHTKWSENCSTARVIP